MLAFELARTTTARTDLGAAVCLEARGAARDVRDNMAILNVLFQAQGPPAEISMAMARTPEIWGLVRASSFSLFSPGP